MPRAGDDRLARLEARRSVGTVAAAGKRGKLRFYAEICKRIRAAALAAGIDPAGIAALRQGDEAAAELRALGETPELALADQATLDADHARRMAAHPCRPDPHDRLWAALQDRAQEFRDGATPAPDDDVLQWYAWTLAQSKPPRPSRQVDRLSAVNSLPLDGGGMGGGDPLAA